MLSSLPLALLLALSQPAMASNSNLIQVSEDLSPYGDPLIQYEGPNSLLEIWTEEAEACTQQNPLTRPQRVVKSCSLVLNDRVLEAAWPLFYTQRAIAYHRLHRPQNMRHDAEAARTGAKEHMLEDVANRFGAAQLWDEHRKTMDALIAQTQSAGHARDFCDVLITRQEVDLAVTYCERAYQIEPTSNAVLYTLTYVYNLAKRGKDARRIAQEGLTLYPSSVPLMYEMAWAIAISGDQEGAIAYTTDAYARASSAGLIQAELLQEFLEKARAW